MVTALEVEAVANIFPKANSMTPCALKHRIRPSAVFIMLRVLVQYLVGRFPNARGARNPNFVHHHTLSLPAMQPTTTRTITPRPFEARSRCRRAAERRIGSTTPSPGGAGRAPPSCWEPTTSDTKIAASFRVSPTALRRRDRVSRFGSCGQSLWVASQRRERNIVVRLGHGCTSTAAQRKPRKQGVHPCLSTGRSICVDEV